MTLTRIAPTPSGYLHAGNVLNFLLTAGAARELGLMLALRIDDADAARVRPEYVDDVFRVLEWLDLPIAAGPRDATELAATYSQSRRTARYWDALRTAQSAGLPLFACVCSRTQLENDKCVRGCTAGLDGYTPGLHRVRWRYASSDVALWGNDDLPTYHWANAVDDADLRTTHVVRGQDLEPSTELHRALAPFVSAGPAIRYAHHRLVTGSGGAKLSKSQGTSRLDLTPALRDEMNALAVEVLPDVLHQLRADEQQPGGG